MPFTTRVTRVAVATLLDYVLARCDSPFAVDCLVVAVTRLVCAFIWLLLFDWFLRCFYIAPARLRLLLQAARITHVGAALPAGLVITLIVGLRDCS